MKYYHVLTPIFLSLCGVYLYFNGFFLCRKELGIISDETPWNENIAFGSRSNDNSRSNPVRSQRKFNRVFLFVVDALRLDFLTCSHDDCTNERNLPFMHSLLKNHNKEALFFGFKADPPTTTSQRLKGLTTGTFPTFMELSRNFDSTRIFDDNIIDQIIYRLNNEQNNRTIFVGDDTWQGLFPDQFDISVPFDSFNTKDLHTVDNGIESFLRTHFGQDSLDPIEDWKLFVVHFLGIDHIGHTFDAKHFLMSERLQKMDELLQFVVDRLPDDAILFMFGDHGMTDDGNHGGATREETDSGLLVYAKDLLSEKCLSLSSEETLHWNIDTATMSATKTRAIRTAPRMVSQVDIVPTLSWLLNIPIPYSSLGAIIPELVYDDCEVQTSMPSEQCDEHSCTNAEFLPILTKALFHNAKQIMRYYSKYFEHSSNKELLKLRSVFEKSSAMIAQGCKDNCVQHYSAIQHSLSVFLIESLEFARMNWTQFSEVNMILGILCLAVALMLLVWHILNMENGKSTVLKLMHSSHSAHVPVLVLILIGALILIITPFSDNLIHFEPYSNFILALICTISLTSKVTYFQIVKMLLFGLIALSQLLFQVKRSENQERRWNEVFINHVSDSIHLDLRAFNQNYAEPVLLVAVVTSLVLSAWRLIISVSPVGFHKINYSMSLFLVGLRLLHFSTRWNDTLISFFKFDDNDIIPRMSSICLLVSLASLLLSFTSNNKTLSYSNFLGIMELIFYQFSTKRSSVIIGWSLISIYNEILSCQSKTKSVSNDSPLDIRLYYSSLALAISFPRLLFFASNHLCQFNAVQLDAGLIGLTKFNYMLSGIQVAINTFGSELFSLCILQDCNMNNVDRMVYLTLCILFRLVVLMTSCLSSLILRRHLMVWAIFAPRTVFEIAFWIIQSISYSFVLVFL